MKEVLKNQKKNKTKQQQQQENKQTNNNNDNTQNIYWDKNHVKTVFSTRFSFDRAGPVGRGQRRGSRIKFHLLPVLLPFS